MLLENYDMRVARFLVQGVDVWLNTPRRPLEASGTSGMKAAANGALNLSVLDGWWAEGYDPALGFAIGAARITTTRKRRTRTTRSRSTVSSRTRSRRRFTSATPAGLPRAWIGRMKRSIARLAPRFSTERMVRDYAARAYVPAMRETDPALDEARLWAP